MKKTSLYLTDEEIDLLRRLSTATGKPQSQLVRDAITEYAAKRAPERRFTFVGTGSSKRARGTSIADDEPKQLKGFGED